MSHIIPASKCRQGEEDFPPQTPSTQQADSDNSNRRLHPFLALSRLHGINNSCSYFWWHNVGPILCSMLVGAGYDVHSQYQQLAFFMTYVCPLMGPQPSTDHKSQSWYSFMTDDFTPIELSWTWGKEKNDSRVRYSVEPIGLAAGTSRDPLNEEIWGDLLARLPTFCGSLDTRIYELLLKQLTTWRLSHESVKELVDLGAATQRFLAFDLERSFSVPKVYLIPDIKALQLQLDSWALGLEAIKSIDDNLRMGIASAYGMLVEFIGSFPEVRRPTLAAIGFDLLAPLDSRIKLYVRSQSTTFDSVSQMLSLGGRLNSADFRIGLQKTRELWYSVLSLDVQSHLDSTPLGHMNHPTSGVLYYYDLKPFKAVPEPKVYIPVRHYGKTDLAVVNGIQVFLRHQGMDEQADQYHEDLCHMFPHYPMDRCLGLHTYVSCGIKGDVVKLTAYINPGPFISVHNNAKL